MQRFSFRAAGLLLAVGLFLSVLPVAAEPRTSSDLLLPYFEVDLEGPTSTLFAVGNAHEGPVDVRVSVATDWGIAVLGVTLRLEAGEVVTVNLKDWLASGDIPTGRLGPAMLAHVQAALTGGPSPKDGLYYGSAYETPGLASGFVTFRVQGANGDRPDSLWGDYFMVGGARLAMGELLVDIDQLSDCRSLCDRHLVRFLDGGAFEDGTELVVWTGRTGAPSPSPQPAYVRAEISGGAFYDERGKHLDNRFLDLMPTQTISVGDLDLPDDFGWIDIVTEDPIYVGVLYRSGDEFSIAVQSWCADEPGPQPPQGSPGPQQPGPDPAASIHLEKHTAGVDADLPPGPALVIGSEIVWQYHVTNTGGTLLSNIVVTDDRGVAVSCPGSSLDAGESMTCTGSGTAVAGDACYCNVGLVIASPPEGGAVTDSDPSHYCAEEVPGVAAIDVEKSTNGADADVAPGPSLFEGDNVQWSYGVTNTGDVTLTGVTVTDDHGVTVTCPGGQPFELAPGESMTCLGNGTATLGQYANVATASGTPEGGGDDLTATDPSHYFGEEVPSGGEGTEGCTLGYWKQEQHFDSWTATGYSPHQTVVSVFSAAGTWPAIGDATLEVALSFNGGSGLEAKARLLVHHAVAALLNGSNPDVDYPRTAAEVIADTNAALASGDEATIEALKDAFDADNNLGCPLS